MKFAMVRMAVPSKSLECSHFAGVWPRDADAQLLCSTRHFLTTASVFSMCFSALELE